MPFNQKWNVSIRKKYVSMYQFRFNFFLYTSKKTQQNKRYINIYSNIFFVFFRENGLIIKEPQLENACVKIGSLVNGVTKRCHVSTKPG